MTCAASCQALFESSLLEDSEESLGYGVVEEEAGRVIERRRAAESSMSSGCGNGWVVTKILTSGPWPSDEASLGAN